MNTKDWFAMTEEEQLAFALSTLKKVEKKNKREANAEAKEVSRRRKAKADFCNIFQTECGFVAM